MSTPSPTHTPVTITRDEVVTEAIPFERATMDDPKTTRGETWVATPGVDGVRTMTYTVTLVDGIETGRALASDVVTTAPVTEVTAVGSYDAPVVQQQAQPASGGCDSNYADACVPISSDVDCAGGEGDGPEYLSGTARVVGTDTYRLDANHDGIACN
ncbi:MAG: G5 domain-containing protein [Microbacterium sp.]|uniref:G5 domain-containing protein n=1 Tax=Microbacterium sp. TaxID=51671 RepID=UPI00260EE218|nr:G5 domain-containing protein [Microbacterium sp.]MCX6502349.1 G5 domain-containing protein [Microbacterium sp.]